MQKSFAVSVKLSIQLPILFSVLGVLYTGGPDNELHRQSFMLSDTAQLPASFGFGRPATKAEIDRWDIDVRPDGKGLPAGAGVAAKGKIIFDAKCVACHGAGGIGGPNGSLVTTTDGEKSKRTEKTIGNYWPYATTVFDYIRRAMPFNQPGSLTNEEVYHLTAYLLSANKLIDEKTMIDAKSLPKVIMPAQKLFVPDDRKGGPEVK
ncbi:c-type cytochrome [Runella slithyformis]|uniref:Cytochrome c class I n=1 Tax=Runella slithyformis (strain ATCC 29530 / DSM 19594 / LMG 11500 / NCIMB 11436 / LSU 4) TaxID=761193 RepID=A0A7U3ZGJ8_RUNSL|nr:cytochrome c [Runella slithyformis]AEI46747.1 cytochrome c class I [Runella slithyformis DSM 19594]